jgi:hypothetical protein
MEISMDFRRSRRATFDPAGPNTSFSEHRAGPQPGWQGARMMSARHRFFRGPSRSSRADSAAHRPATASPPNGSKRQISAFSLLVAAVLALWLMLFLFGHR